MGQGGTYKCNKCGYELNAWTGVGYIYPTVCKETTEQAKKGELGEELKKFFEEHPDGKINCEKVLVRCEDCGYTSRVLSLVSSLRGVAIVSGYKAGCTRRGYPLKWGVAIDFGFISRVYSSWVSP